MPFTTAPYLPAASLVFEELEGSPRFKISKTGHSAVRTFSVPWVYIGAFCEYIGSGNALGLTRMPTHMGAFEDVFVTDIEIIPRSDIPPDLTNIVDPAQHHNTYYSKTGNEETALVIVNYAIHEYGRLWPTSIPRPVHWAAHELHLQLKGGGQFITYPARSLLYSNTPSSSGIFANSYGYTARPPWPPTSSLTTSQVTPHDMNCRQLLSTKEITLTIDNVDDPATDYLDSIMGTVNAITYLGCPPQTLLFENYDLVETYRPSINRPFCHQVRLNFKQRFAIEAVKYSSSSAGEPESIQFMIRGWNHEYRDYPAGWTYVIMSDGRPRYEIIDFSGMLMFITNSPAGSSSL